MTREGVQGNERGDQEPKHQAPAEFEFALCPAASNFHPIAVALPRVATHSKTKIEEGAVNHRAKLFSVNPFRPGASPYCRLALLNVRGKRNFVIYCQPYRLKQLWRSIHEATHAYVHNNSQRQKREQH